MDLLLFEIPVLLLFAGKGKISLVISLFIFAAILSAAFLIQRKQQIRLKHGINTPILTSLISLSAAAVFYMRWNNSGRMEPFATLLHLPLKQTTVLTALLLALLSLPGIDNLLTIFIAFFTKKDSPRFPEKGFAAVFIAITACAVMFLNSRCSPFYPFNDWGDPNTMFTVGKGVLKGLVPYRDLYEQKGPVLVFLHTFGAAVSYDTFFGIWILELISCFVFLFLAYKTISLFHGKKAILTVPILAGVIYSSYAFRAGDTAEEFSLPLLAYALYVGFKSLVNDKLPSGKEFFLIGVTSGLVFWQKYSMTGLYLGWILIFLIFAVKSQKLSELVRGCCLILGGVVLVTMPVFIYFAANSALDSLLGSYFYNNLAYYSQEYTLRDNILIGFENSMASFTGAMLFSFLGILWLLIRRKFKLFFLTAASFICAFIFISAGGTHGPYYCLPLALFSSTGFCALLDLFELAPIFRNSGRNLFQAISAPALITGLLILCGFSHNLRFLEIPKEEMFQFQMKDIIEQSGIENPSILYYEIGDAGVNTTAGLLPNIRYFCYYNNDKMTEIKETQDQCIREQCVDYIIARTKFDNVYPHFETYEHRAAIVGMADRTLEYFHYYTPNY